MAYSNLWQVGYSVLTLTARNLTYIKGLVKPNFWHDLYRYLGVV